MRSVLCGLLLLTVFGCSGKVDNTVDPLSPDPALESVETVDVLAETVLPDPTEQDDVARPLRQISLYYPSDVRDGLQHVRVGIYDTPAPEDVARQILASLLGRTPPEGCLRAVPKGTRLRQVYLYRDVAWVNFSREFLHGVGGGSAAELSAIYAVVNSVALNLEGIERVGILIDGQPVRTLNGHLDLSRPLVPNSRLVLARA